MFIKMWEFVGYLGMIILILILFGIIFALMEYIYVKVKGFFLNRKLRKALEKSVFDFALSSSENELKKEVEKEVKKSFKNNTKKKED